MNVSKKVDAVIIGGGFYGCVLALSLRKLYKKVLLLEKEADILLKASYNNQARIHNGYHYPRSFITASRSHANYERFVLDFKNSVVDSFNMVYAISTNSKVNSYQFFKFCKQIGSPVAPATAQIKKLFDSRLIEDAFFVEEAVFNAGKLREILRERLASAKIKIQNQTEVLKISRDKEGIVVHLGNGEKILSSQVLNCTYSNINSLLENSNLLPLPLKHELTEMPILKMSGVFRKMGITIMDGPFFSIMPFPDKKMHSLHHVRYTPRTTFLSKQEEQPKNSNAIFMIKDARRYIPKLGDVKYEGSLYELKTVLIQNEINDARPILFRKDYGMKNFHVIMGGKIDNIYDVIAEMGL